MAEVTKAFASLVLVGAAAAAAAPAEDNPHMKTYHMIADMKAKWTISDFRTLAKLAGDPLDKGGCTAYEAMLERTDEGRLHLGRVAPALQQVYDEKLKAEGGDEARATAINAMEQRGCKVPAKSPAPGTSK